MMNFESLDRQGSNMMDSESLDRQGPILVFSWIRVFSAGSTLFDEIFTF